MKALIKQSNRLDFAEVTKDSGGHSPQPSSSVPFHETGLDAETEGVNQLDRGPETQTRSFSGQLRKGGKRGTSARKVRDELCKNEEFGNKVEAGTNRVHQEHRLEEYVTGS